MIKQYCVSWLKPLGEFRRYRNTTIATLVVCLLTLINRHHSLALWILPGEYRQYFIPVTFLSYGLIFFFIPLLTAPLLAPADRFGLRIGKFRTWIVDVVLAWIILLALILIFGRNRDFLQYYPIYKPAAYAWKTFLFYQLCQFVYMFGWEFIFRGYLFFTAKKEIGIIPALILQMLPFAFLHIGKPELEIYGSVFAGLFLGLIALRANSFLPCAILHFSVACTMDLFAALYKHTLHF
ncbi:MAG: CPBP family intramembrane glutamic endopeptidase [Phycisphaerae bacterium]